MPGKKQHTTRSAIVSVTLIMGVLSFACGFMLLGFNAAAIDHIKHRYTDYCATPGSDCKFSQPIIFGVKNCTLFK